MTEALLVDDDRSIIPALSEIIAAEGFDVHAASSLAEARDHLASRRPELALVDLVLPDGNGLDLVREHESSDLLTHFMIITAHPALDNVIHSLRYGAVDYLTKPIDVDQLRRNLREIRENLRRYKDRTEVVADDSDRRGALRGKSSRMREIYARIDKAAPTETTVFLFGESGTGKELVARYIHEASNRRDGPFLALNCGAIPHSLIGNELFGHERGSYTDANRRHEGFFERAHGGTLFLDELTEMPPELQVQLLRVLETGQFTRLGGSQEIKVDVRLIAATNRTPEQAVAQGKLREDLLYRLMVFPVHLPPLREREEDIAMLARHFIDELNLQEGKEKVLADDALLYIREYHWPGNVRELRNAIQHAFIVSGDEIRKEHFPPGLTHSGIHDGPTLRFTVGTPIGEFERRFIFATLDHFKGNKRLAAESLGVSLKTLYNRLHRYTQDDSDAGPNNHH